MCFLVFFAWEAFWGPSARGRCFIYFFLVEWGEREKVAKALYNLFFFL